MAQAIKHVSIESLVSQAIISAKDLEYADPHAWALNAGYAEFLGGNPNVSGKKDVNQLDKGVTYEVSFLVAMKDHEVESEVKMTLELPNGIKHEKNEILKLSPFEGKAVLVAEFMNIFPCGDIKVSFSGVHGNTWKGLLLAGVGINKKYN